jgi:hypothetical protein
MRIRHRPLKFGKHEKTKDIVFTSCWHIGNPACREKHIEELMIDCAKTKTPWIMLGDIIECIAPVDPRYHCETHGETVISQCEMAGGYMAQGIDTCWGLHIGNHEDKVSAKVGDLTRLTLMNGLRYKSKGNKQLVALTNDLHLGGACFTNVKCPNGELTIFTAHSRLSVSSAGTSDPDRDRLNRQIRLRRKLKAWRADLKVVGHGHTNLVSPPVARPVLSMREFETKQVDDNVCTEWCAMAASMFLNYHSSEDYPDYAEMALYPPTDIGYIRATGDRSGTVLDVVPVSV